MMDPTQDGYNAIRAEAMTTPDPTGDALKASPEPACPQCGARVFQECRLLTGKCKELYTGPRTPPVSMDEVEALLSRFDAELLGLHRDPYINSRIVSFGFLEDLHDLLTRIKERRA